MSDSTPHPDIITGEFEMTEPAAGTAPAPRPAAATPTRYVHPSEMAVIELSGYRVDGNVPIVGPDGGLAPETRELFDNIGDMPKRRLLRAASLGLYIVAGFGLMLFVSDHIDGSLSVVFVAFMAYCAVCGWLDENYIQPLTRTIARVELRFGARAIRYNEGIEIGYLNYSDVETIYLFAPLDERAEGEVTGAPGSVGLLIIEDSLGKRMGVTEAPGELLEAAVARLRATTPDVVVVDCRAAGSGHAN